MSVPLPPPLPWRVRTQPERLILVGAAAAALVVFILFLARSADVAVPGCVWKCATGIPCAGCGGTRALAALLGGSFFDALSWNPGAVFASIMAGSAALYAACVLIFRLDPWRPGLLNGGWWKVAVVSLIAVNWVYLLLAGRG